NESGFPQIYIAPFPGPGAKRQVSTVRARQPRWRRDGKELYYISADNRLIAIDVNTQGDTLTFGVERPLATLSTIAQRSMYDVAPDGRFLVNAVVQQPATAPAPITVVVNWPALLKR